MTPNLIILQTPYLHMVLSLSYLSPSNILYVSLSSNILLYSVSLTSAWHIIKKKSTNWYSYYFEKINLNKFLKVKSYAKITILPSSSVYIIFLVIKSKTNIVKEITYKI